MEDSCILHVADYSAAFFSNFLASLVHLKREVASQLGLGTVLVFPQTARDRLWMRSLVDSGAVVEFVDRGGSHRERTRTLIALARKHRASLIHTHFGTFDVDAAYAASRTKTPVVWHMHSPYPDQGSARQRLGERVKFALLARIWVDRIVAVSPSVAESATQHGAPPSRFTVVPNGIDLDRVRPRDPSARSVLRSRYGIGNDETVFLLLGWSPQRKGVDLLAQATTALSPEWAGRSRCLVVSGEANAAELQEIVGRVPAVHVIPPMPDVADLYGLADCFVSASRAEGLPYAVGEAMASELPVISSDLPQVVAFYAPAGEGLLTFKSGDSVDLAQAMTRVLEMGPDRRREAGRSNAAFVRGTLSLDRWSSGVLEVYRSVLGNEKRSGAA
jgi:glycosyltransferase involved in cell wall biosynthesis